MAHERGTLAMVGSPLQLKCPTFRVALRAQYPRAPPPPPHPRERVQKNAPARFRRPSPDAPPGAGAPEPLPRRPGPPLNPSPPLRAHLRLATFRLHVSASTPSPGSCGTSSAPRARRRVRGTREHPPGVRAAAEGRARGLRRRRRRRRRASRVDRVRPRLPAPGSGRTEATDVSVVFALPRELGDGPLALNASSATLSLAPMACHSSSCARKPALGRRRGARGGRARARTPGRVRERAHDVREDDGDAAGDARVAVHEDGGGGGGGSGGSGGRRRRLRGRMIAAAAFRVRGRGSEGTSRGARGGGAGRRR